MGSLKASLVKSSLTISFPFISDIFLVEAGSDTSCGTADMLTKNGYFPFELMG